MMSDLDILESYVLDGYSGELACWLFGMTEDPQYYDYLFEETE